MRKKIISLLLMGTMAAGLFTGCGGSSSGENGMLNLFIWTEYVPDSVIEKFEEDYGVKVNVTTFSTNEDMLAKVKSESEGTYDIVQPSDYMVFQMIAQDMLMPLDKDVVTNISNIGDEYLDLSYDPGNVYSIPYQGGACAIAVNTAKVDITITKYADLFDPALKNSLLVLDDYRAVIGMTARSMGYGMSETDPDKLAEIEDKLLTLKDNIKIYDSDSPKSSLISGDCSVAFCWNAEIALAMAEDSDIEVVYPEEGPYLFMDNWCVTKGAKNSENAMKFINYMLEAETSKMVSEEYPYLNPNQAGVELLGSEYYDNPAKNPPVDAITKGEYLENVDTDTIAAYDEMWTKLKQ